MPFFGEIMFKRLECDYLERKNWIFYNFVHNGKCPNLNFIRQKFLYTHLKQIKLLKLSFTNFLCSIIFCGFWIISSRCFQYRSRSNFDNGVLGLDRGACHAWAVISLGWAQYFEDIFVQHLCFESFYSEFFSCYFILL